MFTHTSPELSHTSPELSQCQPVYWITVYSAGSWFPSSAYPNDECLYHFVPISDTHQFAHWTLISDNGIELVEQKVTLKLYLDWHVGIVLVVVEAAMNWASSLALVVPLTSCIQVHGENMHIFAQFANI